MEHRLLQKGHRLYIIYNIRFDDSKLNKTIIEQFIKNFTDYIEILKYENLTDEDLKNENENKNFYTIISNHNEQGFIIVNLGFWCLNKLWNVYNNKELKELITILTNSKIYISCHIDSKEM